MVLAFAAACAIQASNAFAIHDKDRVLFYGDSITDNQYYPQFVEQYVLTRFPKMKVAFMNYGWSGDRVTGGGGGDIKLRLSRDVFPNKPSMVTIMLGMNDASYKPCDEGLFHTFADGYESIARLIQSTTNARLTFIQPSPYDEVTLPPAFENGGYNGVLLRYGKFVQELATEFKAIVADFNSPVVAMLQKANAADAKRARTLIADRVHPNAASHIVMGAALLKAWNAPSLVSSTKIDAALGKGTAENAQVRDVRKGKAGLTWRSLEGSLPLYFWRANADVAFVLANSDVEHDLNNETLTVTQLPAGEFDLLIDGEIVGSFSSADLSKGIDLTRLDTPMMRQSAGIFALTEKRQSLRWTMWRSFVVNLDGYGLNERKSAIASSEKLEREIIAKQRREAQPVWHSFAITALKQAG